MLSYIISKKEQSAHLISNINFEIKLAAHDTRFVMYEYVKAKINDPVIDIQLGQLGYDRVFEDCFTFINGDEEDRFEAIQFLFDQIGGKKYLDSIIRSKNQDCYNFLFTKALSLPKTSSNAVLDLGSGPGLIADTQVPKLSGNLICFDTSECNLEVSKKRGLTTITIDQFFEIKPSSIDIVISSYVLHYESLTNREFKQVACILNENGVWAANFHKAKGVSWFLDKFKNYNEFDLNHSDSIFGSILIAQKKHEFK